MIVPVSSTGTSFTCSVSAFTFSMCLRNSSGGGGVGVLSGLIVVCAKAPMDPAKRAGHHHQIPLPHQFRIARHLHQ